MRHNYQVIEIPQPNTTRVAGCPIMFQALIRNKWQLDGYAGDLRHGCPKFRNRYPKDESWKMLAIYEAILLPSQRCSISIQSDVAGASCGLLLEIFLSRYEIQKMKRPLADGGGVPTLLLTLDSYPDKTDLWDASSTMEKLECKRVDLEFETLHRDGKLLINRLLKEYDFYFLKEKDENAEKAILANPLVAEHIPELFIYIKIYTADDVKRIHKAFVDDMADKYCSRPSQIGGAFAKQHKQAAAAAKATFGAVPTTRTGAQPATGASVATSTTNANDPTRLTTATETTPPAVPVTTDTAQAASTVPSSTRKRRDPFLEFTRAKAQSSVEETEALVGMTGRASDAEKEEAL
jgi:hypothetical protein